MINIYYWSEFHLYWISQSCCLVLQWNKFNNYQISNMKLRNQSGRIINYHFLHLELTLISLKGKKPLEKMCLTFKLDRKRTFFIIFLHLYKRLEWNKFHLHQVWIQNSMHFLFIPCHSRFRVKLNLTMNRHTHIPDLKNLSLTIR